MASGEERKAYIGIRPCGCVTYCAVVGAESEKSEKRELAKIVASGRRIEVTTVADARERWTTCPHNNPGADVGAELDDLIAKARS